MPFNLGAPELILIVAIALIVFGPGKLPEIGGAIGKSLREFRRASSELTEELSRESRALKQSASLQSASLESTPTCPKCGAKLERDAKFCGQCGTSFALKT